MAQFTQMDGENRILGIAVVWEYDETGEPDYLETDSGRYSDVHDRQERERYEREDADRLAAFNAGDWHMQGCWAQAKVVVGGVIQTIRSGGLWGIESDSDEGYRREVEEEERSALFAILESLGFDTREQKAA